MAENPPDKLRVMVDANVLFAGAGWPRFPYEVLRHAVLADYQLVLTARIIDEAQVAIAEIVPSAARRLTDILAACQYEEGPTPTDEEIATYPHLVRDAKDVHVALAAMKAKVDYLVTQDKDLTDPSEPVHQHVKVLLPGAFLRQHMGWSSEELEAIRRRIWDDFK